jgi:hypothetical protein
MCAPAVTFADSDTLPSQSRQLSSPWSVSTYPPGCRMDRALFAGSDRSRLDRWSSTAGPVPARPVPPGTDGRGNGIAMSNLPGTSVRQCRARTSRNRLVSAVPAYDGPSHGTSWVVLFSGFQCVHTCRGCWSGFPVAPGGGGDGGSARMTAAGDGVDTSGLW